MGNYLISISGPTAIGKTTLSINLAKELNTEIISFDSNSKGSFCYCRCNFD